MNMLGMDDLLGERLGGALVDGDVGADHGQGRQHIARGRLQIDVAEDGGDGVRWAAVGDEHQQRLGVVDTAVGVEDEPVGHYSCG